MISQSKQFLKELGPTVCGPLTWDYRPLSTQPSFAQLRFEHLVESMKLSAPAVRFVPLNRGSAGARRSL